MRFLSLLFSLSLLCSVSTYAQDCFDNDSLGLMRLYDGLGVTYNPLNPVMTWPGVAQTATSTISPAEFAIIEINLSNLGLTGTLRDSIFEGDTLTQLTILNLSDNNITALEGQLKYDNLYPSTLDQLYLNNNSFAAYPNFFSDLTANLGFINVLDLGGIFPLNTASYDVFFTPLFIPGLNILNLSNNGFTDTLDISGLLSLNSSVTNLDLSANNLEAIVSFTTTALTFLDVSSNDLLDIVDIQILLDYSPNLVDLIAQSVRTTAFQDSFRFELVNTNSNMNTLDLSVNNLIGPIPLQLFQNLDSIQTLNLGENFLSGPLPQAPYDAASGFYYYTGLGRIQDLNLSGNKLSGPLHLDWLFTQQLVNYGTQSGSDLPLLSLSCENNRFNAVLPKLIDPITTQISTNFPARYVNLNEVKVHNNALEFVDLYRMKTFFRFQQGSVGPVDHYYPQGAAASSGFTYAPQSEIGAGGVKRRNPGDSILLVAGHGIVEATSTGPIYMGNRYYWERADTSGIIGGTATALLDQLIGVKVQNGTKVALDLSSFDSLAAFIPSYRVGVNGSAEEAHQLQLNPLDSTTHAQWLYRATITNDSFPNLSILTKMKKIEVGPCLDASGQPILCQQMILRFDPALFSGLNATEKDSVKQLIMEETGSQPIESCLCGDLELWTIADSNSLMLEAFGSGTKKATTSTSGKPQLLSADPNYRLLTSSGAPSSAVSSIPTGSGNATAKTLVAIIDSGMDYGYTPLHSHISEGLPIDTTCINDAIFGYNFLEQNNDAADDHGHGTGVAGIVAGISKNNLLPDAGTGNIGILPLKYTNKDGDGTLFNAACALRFAATFEKLLPTGDTARVRVINASWGFNGEASQFLEDALKYVGQNCDVLVVASAGNAGTINHGADSLLHWPSNSIYDPADTIDADNILAVAAVNTHTGDNLASYSNYSQFHVDIAAQGTDSTTQVGTTNGFAVVNGTSFASGQVSRAAALLFDKYPDATYFAIKSALIKGVDKLQSPDSLKLRSGGRLNYTKADSILNIMTDRTICADYFPYISVDKIENIHDAVSIYPNPVSNQLNIEWDSELSSQKINLSIYNVQGQLIFQKELEEGNYNYNISTQDYPVGVYFIKLQVDQNLISKRFMKI